MLPNSRASTFFPNPTYPMQTPQYPIPNTKLSKTKLAMSSGKKALAVVAKFATTASFYAVCFRL